MQDGEALVIDLIDIGAILLQQGHHLIIAPKHRIMQTGEPFIITGPQPHQLAIFRIFLRLRLYEMVIRFQVEFGHVDVVTICGHMQ